MATPGVEPVDLPSSDGDSDVETEVPDRVNKSMSVTDVASFLRKHGIPEQFCDAFKGMFRMYIHVYTCAAELHVRTIPCTFITCVHQQKTVAELLSLVFYIT